MNVCFLMLCFVFNVCFLIFLFVSLCFLSVFCLVLFGFPYVSLLCFWSVTFVCLLIPIVFLCCFGANIVFMYACMIMYVCPKDIQICSSPVDSIGNVCGYATSSFDIILTADPKHNHQRSPISPL